MRVDIESGSEKGILVACGTYISTVNCIELVHS